MSDRCTECKQGYTVEGAAAYPDHVELCRLHADVKLPEVNDHDVDALVSLATDHRDKWGDSCHHALAEEVVRLRGEVIRLRERLQLNADLNVERI